MDSDKSINNSCSFALRRSYCNPDTSESEKRQSFGFSKLVDDLVTKRNIFSKRCSTSTANTLSCVKNNQQILTVDLESERDEKMDTKKDQLVDLNDLLLTLDNEVEKRFESLDLKFRMQLVEEKEKNLELKEQILKIRQEFIPKKQYNDLKEFYEKKICDLETDKKFNLENFHPQLTTPTINNQEIEKKNVTPIDSFEHIKTADKTEMKELKEKLNKECEKKLSILRTNLENECKLKLNLLRIEMSQNFVISMDKEVQTDDELKDGQNNHSKSPAIMEMVNQSVDLKSTLLMDKEVQTDNDIFLDDEVIENLSEIRNHQSNLINDSIPIPKSPKSGIIVVANCRKETPRQSDESSSLELTQKKRKRSEDLIDFSSTISDLFVFSSSSSEFKTLKRVNSGLEFYEIPSGYLGARLCIKCNWIEKVVYHSYSAHYNQEHFSEPLRDGTIMSQFREVIVNNKYFDSLSGKKSKGKPTDSTIDSNHYDIPANCFTVLICSVCRWIQSPKRNSYHQHFREYHGTLSKDEHVVSKFKLVVMETTKFNSARAEWERLNRTLKKNRKVSL